MRTVIIILLIVLATNAKAQFAPQASIVGSTAIAASSAQIVNWASGCTIMRGYKNIAQPQMGYASAGDSTSVIGVNDNFIVSLGDSGVATLSFPHPIINGVGVDFVVFENGFANPANAEEAYLELAFVEVSSDGINYFRFPATSNTQSDTQILGAGVYMNARKLNNLAGKYIVNYGTPFDLQEMSGIVGLDVNNIIRVRIVDVIGDINTHITKDNENKKINDPYPTPFPTGGFDLDAVGVIHQNTTTTISNQMVDNSVKLFPNPTTNAVHIETSERLTLVVSNMTGKILQQTTVDKEITIDVQALTAGIYFFQFQDNKGKRWVERITKL